MPPPPGRRRPRGGREPKTGVVTAGWLTGTAPLPLMLHQANRVFCCLSASQSQATIRAKTEKTQEENAFSAAAASGRCCSGSGNGGCSRRASGQEKLVSSVSSQFNLNFSTPPSTIHKCPSSPPPAPRLSRSLLQHAVSSALPSVPSTRTGRDCGQTPRAEVTNWLDLSLDERRDRHNSNRQR